MTNMGELKRLFRPLRFEEQEQSDGIRYGCDADISLKSSVK